MRIGIPLLLVEQAQDTHPLQGFDHGHFKQVTVRLSHRGTQQIARDRLTTGKVGGTRQQLERNAIDGVGGI